VKRIVLDASVAVAWFVPESEETTRASAAVLDGIVDGSLRPIVPELFWYEVLAVLIRRTSETSGASAAVTRLTALGFERIPLEPDLALRAKQIARAHRLTGYDAVYAALAELTGAQWWTFDRAAHERVVDLGISRLVVDAAPGASAR
jgi:predicted nucleic acid-binding protein